MENKDFLECLPIYFSIIKDYWIPTMVVIVLFLLLLKKAFCEKSSLEIILNSIKDSSTEQVLGIVVIIFMIVFASIFENIYLKGILLVISAVIIIYLIKSFSIVSRIGKKMKKTEESAKNDSTKIKW